MIKLQLKPDASGLRVREAPVDGKPIGQLHDGEVIESLETLKETRAKLGVEGKWIKVRSEHGVEGFTAAWLLELAPDQDLPADEPELPTEPLPFEPEPADPPADQGDVVAVKPTTKGLRLREAPVDGEPVGQVDDDDVLISLEDAKSTQAKLGVEGKWLHVKTIYGLEAYTAAWFLEAYNGPIPEPVKPIDARSLLGVNLDIDHPVGKPDASELGMFGWVRIKFNVSFDPHKQGDARYGNTDVDYTYNRYIGAIDQYLNGGLKVLCVLTHQAFGEGAGYHWPSMTSASWREFTPKYAAMAKRIAAKFAGTGKISAYQIWNEQDTPPEHARAAVPISAADYAHLLAETIKAIRSVDKDVKILTGGHVGGPGNGATYAQQTIAAMPAGIRPDGIAFHPYGRGAVSDSYSIFGPIQDAVNAYSAVLPGHPVWISEWGVLNVQGQDHLAESIKNYARGFMHILETEFPGQVAAAIWYAWADSMDNGYGFVRENGSAKYPLYDAFKKP